MADEASAQGATPASTARTEQVLTALLAIDPAVAAEVRERSPARRRPQGRYGPVLDLGAAEPGPDDPDDGSASVPTVVD